MSCNNVARLQTMRFLLYIGVLCVGASGKAEESDLPDVSREDLTASIVLTDVDKADYDARSNIAELILAAQKLKGSEEQNGQIGRLPRWECFSFTKRL